MAAVLEVHLKHRWHRQLFWKFKWQCERLFKRQVRVQVEAHVESTWRALGGHLEGQNGLQVALGGQFGGTNGIQLALGGQFEGPSGAKRCPRGSKLAPRGTQEAPRWAQEMAKSVQVGPKLVTKAAKWTPSASKLAPKRPSRGVQEHLECKTAEP